MTKKDLELLLLRHRRGSLSTAKALSRLISVTTESLDFATIDHLREARQGFPEVIYCEGKTPGQVGGIASRICAHGSVLLATRGDREHFSAVRRKVRGARFNPVSRTITANESKIVPRGRGTILVISAGTSDIPVAEEALETARVMGNETGKLYDVGVAGIHRILRRTDMLGKASVIIVVAGMEGALASVVGGLVSVPVIAVPTSVGYGASFRGVAALLGMLNSCAAGVTVVNIDNGFGAGFAASVINRRR
ncbi:MAG TPA: nickel pincer cofactor biosynthesis protein LarB [Bacteroidota bacterium]|nr:nickel pincer cofactor biosynthesis protein LarB [Bacteroidota bacterium]